MHSSEKPSPVWLLSSAIAAFVFLISWGLGLESVVGPSLVACLVLLAIYFTRHPRLHVLTFTFWVLAGGAAALFWPSWFIEWNGYRLSNLNTYLIQIIMFGMGASLSLRDFANALEMPKAVLIGMVLQFSVMPVLGWTVATAFGFEPDVAAGIILIGSCSGGVASNVMVFLARGNVALSVTMTACSTLLAPLMTPLLMQHLAGRLIEVNFWAMVLSIINLVIIPIGGGLIGNKVLERRRAVSDFLKTLLPLALLLGAGVAVSTAVVQALGGTTVNSDYMMDRLHQAIWLIGMAIVIGWVLNVTLAGRRAAFDRVLPVVSMTAICIILTIISANSREDLLSIGLLLLLAACIHNIGGYLLGYWMSGLLGLSVADRRTVGFEVGMQNGGMAVGLALDVLKSNAAALAPAIFSTLMNVTGSMLASWWRDRPADRADQV